MRKAQHGSAQHDQHVVGAPVQAGRLLRGVERAQPLGAFVADRPDLDPPVGGEAGRAVAVRRPGPGLEHQLVIRLPDGHVDVVEVTSAPVHDPDARMVDVVPGVADDGEVRAPRQVDVLEGASPNFGRVAMSWPVAASAMTSSSARWKARTDSSPLQTADGDDESSSPSTSHASSPEATSIVQIRPSLVVP
ncbi:hypothetical protein [Actinomadura oligospora]|uniref:hypothetical protein n=1 Tax=Actinomadura oligospora TaxID=111804 RepID=UPI00047A0847|nr:hypothetical protein [Actinomadura oligospora]